MYSHTPTMSFLVLSPTIQTQTPPPASKFLCLAPTVQNNNNNIDDPTIRPPPPPPVTYTKTHTFLTLSQPTQYYQVGGEEDEEEVTLREQRMDSVSSIQSLDSSSSVSPSVKSGFSDGFLYLGHE